MHVRALYRCLKDVILLQHLTLCTYTSDHEQRRSFFSTSPHPTDMSAQDAANPDTRRVSEQQIHPSLWQLFFSTLSPMDKSPSADTAPLAAVLSRSMKRAGFLWQMLWLYTMRPWHRYKLPMASDEACMCILAARNNTGYQLLRYGVTQRYAQPSPHI